MVLSLALISCLRRKKRSPKAMIKGREKRRRRGDNLLSLEVPLELQIEILTRLPAKSLMRFKCVSKLWFSLIRCRYFTNLYRTVAPPIRAPPRLYMSLVDHLDCNSIEDCHKPYESALLSLSSSSAKSLDQDLILPGMGGRKMVVIRGLILYSVCGKACIFNPTTRQSLTLPAFKSNIFAQKGFRNFYFFGYDHVLDQYKVVCTSVIASKRFKRITSEHWVLVLEAGGSWKRIEFDQQPHRPTKPGLCIDGVIYYLASTCVSRNILVCFDVRSEAFNIFQRPDDVVHAYGEPVHVIEYDGKPCICDYTLLGEEGLVNPWVLEKGGKWSRTSRVLQPCQMHFVNNDIDLIVAGTTQNGEVILTPLSLISPYYILYYDLQKNHLRKVRIRGIPKHWFGKPCTDLLIYFKHMDQSQNIMHLEI